MLSSRPVAGLCLLGVLAATSHAVAAPQEERPLPRWREGGTPYDPAQSLAPYSLQSETPRLAPTSGLIESPPEYTPTRGVMFRYSTGAWPNVVRDCVAAITGDPAYDDLAYVVVANASQQNSATTAFIAAGADMSKVVFLTHPTESIWLRDYGPHFVWQDGALGIVDSHYYPTRPQDNFIPTRVGDDNFIVPTYDMGLYYSGGNFQPGPARTGFLTALINLDNPAAAGFNSSLIAELYSRFQGADVLHILPQLPTTVDATGHIDMWFYIVDPTNVVISQFKPGSNATAITITNNAVTYMQNLGFTVHRPWAWNAGGVHYTYANAFRVNNRIFVPTYGAGNAAYLADDAFALSTWQTAAGPGVQIVPINCYDIIPASGAIHCITMQVPRRTASIPAVHVTAPNGAQLLAAGESYEITWAATDTDNLPIPSAELSWSPDGGSSWLPIANVVNTGRYSWTVPTVATDRARVRVKVTAADLDQAEAQSETDFRIAPAQRSVYDFSTGAGVDRWIWGSQTSSWTVVNGVRTPVSTQLSPANYAALAASDATGGNADTNRYLSAVPTSGNESTHVIEFTLQESAAQIDDIEMLVEGYANNCAEMELYVWDYVANQWTDTDGNFGQNRYLDSFAGNRDALVRRNIRSDFARFIGAGNRMTFLLYVERAANRVYVDYVRLTVTDVLEPGATFCAGDGSSAPCPCSGFGQPGNGCANSASPAGARLEAFGVASVSADGVDLALWGAPSTANALFFQGANALNGGAGAPFGAGLRCIAAPTRRLGVRSAVGGAVAFGPSSGDTPISVRGWIPPTGGTYLYQVWYRDPSGPCTAGTFNLSNGVSITWTP